MTGVPVEMHTYPATTSERNSVASRPVLVPRRIEVLEWA